MTKTSCATQHSQTGSHLIDNHTAIIIPLSWTQLSHSDHYNNIPKDLQKKMKQWNQWSWIIWLPLATCIKLCLIDPSCHRRQFDNQYKNKCSLYAWGDDLYGACHSYGNRTFEVTVQAWAILKGPSIMKRDDIWEVRYNLDLHAGQLSIPLWLTTSTIHGFMTGVTTATVVFKLWLREWCHQCYAFCL